MLLVEDRCVERYISSLAEESRPMAKRILMRFFSFAGVSPEEAVCFQREHPVDYRFVDLAYEWLERGELAVATKRTRFSMVNAFFLSNRVPLPKDRHRFHSNKEKVAGELSVEEFRRILLSCNRTYRAAFLVQFQSGSGVGELVHINTHHAGLVWDEIKRGRHVIRLTMPGRKRNRNIKPYYTFLGGDACRALRDLFHSCGWRKDSVLFRNEYGQPLSRNSLSTYFRAHAIKTGVIKQFTPSCLDCGGETVKQLRSRYGLKRTYYVCTVCDSVHLAGDFPLGPHERGGIRYRAKTHELRDLFHTQWHYAQKYAGVDAIASEFFMGHGGRIDPDEYDKIMRDTAYAMGEYRKALPFLNVLSENPLKVARTVLDDELAGQRKELELLRRELARVSRVKADPLLKDIERLAQLPGGKQLFASIVKDAKEKLAEMLKMQEVK